MQGFKVTAVRVGSVLASLAMLVFAGSASANNLQMKDMIAQSGVQQTMLWTLGAEVMRLALKVDEQGAMERLRHSREQFVVSLEFQRQGISELHDRGVDSADAMFVAITDVSRKWAAVDEALEPIWGAGTVSAAQAGDLLDLNRRLTRSIEQVLVHFNAASSNYGVVTVIGKAILATERERALGQRITADFMAATLGVDMEERLRLSDSATQFESLLHALQHGDPELGLIPPPTADLREKLSQVEAIWQQMTPHLASAIGGDPVSRESVYAIAQSSTRLFAELGSVNELLAGLVPGGNENIIRSRGPAPDDRKML